MSTRTFQARSVSELLDASIRLIKEHFRTLFLLSAIAYFPLMIANLALPQVPPGQEMTEAQIAQVFSVIWIMLLAFMWWIIVWTAMTAHSSDLYLGREASPTAALARAFRRTFALVWATIMKWAGIYLITMLIAIPIFIVLVIVAVAAGIAGAADPANMPMFFVLIGVVYLALIALSAAVYARFYFVGTVLVLENLGPWNAIIRSFDLTKGQYWRVVKSYLLVYIIFGAVMAMAYAVAYGLTRNWAMMTVIGQAASIVVFPLLPVATALLYYDIRIRKEGYDLEMMAQALGGPLPEARTAEGVRGA